MAEITQQDKVHLVRAVLTDHESLWEQRQTDMRRYKAAYMTDFYKERNAFDDAAQLRVETSDAYNYIEGFIASLFSKAPAVEIGGDVQGKGNKALVKEIVNRFLFDQKTQLELASRLALIYPNAFIKLYPRHSENLLDQIGIRACSPWEVIVDRDANVWSEQRFIGHIYWENIAEMNQRFGPHQWIPVKKENYFGPTSTREDPYDQATNIPDNFMYCKVVELYDFINNKLYFWTPNVQDTDRLLEESDIPLEASDGTPVSPIVPLYYSRVPDQPLDGISAMKRIYDQVYEKNILRSFWANAVRRDTRQFLVREGAIDEEALAKITAGVDGAMIPVDTENLAGVISVVPSVPISSNHDRYLQQIDQDLAKGSVMAPFTRGEATKSSATEVAALAQYTASEIGRLARERDSMIEIISERFIQALTLVAGEDKEIVLVDGVPELITPEKIIGKFKYTALDQASTPIAESVRRQQLLQLVPVLSNLGVEQWKLRDEVIRLFDLPRSFSETPEVQEEVGPRGQGMPRGRPDGAPYENRPESAEASLARQLGGGRGIKLPPFGSGPGQT